MTPHNHNVEYKQKHKDVCHSFLSCSTCFSLAVDEGSRRTVLSVRAVLTLCCFQSGHTARPLAVVTRSQHQ